MNAKIKLFLAPFLLFLNCAYAQWMPLNYGPSDMGHMASSGSVIFASVLNGIIISTNNGESWNYSTTGLPANMGGNVFASLNSKVFTNTPSGVYSTTNGGSSWENSNNGIGNRGVSVFAVSGSKIYAGNYSAYDTGYLFVSSDFGANWSSLGRTGFGIRSLTISGNNIFAGSVDQGVYMSSNDGQNWTTVNNGLTNLNVWTITSIGTSVFAGTPDYPTGGVYRTTNNGASWELVNNGLVNRDIRSFAVYENTLFAGTAGGVFLSTDFGQSWQNRNQGFTTLPAVFCMLITNNYIFAGIFQNRAYRRLLNDILDAGQNGGVLIKNFELMQNYPNPFNQTSIFKFQCSMKGHVNISVYDIAGREVRTLVNETLQPGTYEVRFDGSELNSGMYFVRMTAGKFTETRKMVLLK